MAYEPLHHKYRPQTFADLVGQEAISTTLSNAIRTERIAPAYLFAGPRGTGKTSSARILAKSLNCLQRDRPTEQPCGVCEVCRAITKGVALDVIEVDAASNTGVDNIRELIERAQFAPVQCRYKIYVLDEVHMLSTPAFNALLKTLEEPPEHVVFVLATTDPQRVLPTIISRCQRFDFRRIALEAMVTHLQAIAAQENINIAENAVQLLAQIAQGGLRDAESLLDQLSLLPNQITVERVWDLVGMVPEQNLTDLLVAIVNNNPEAVLDQARHLMDRGHEPLTVLHNLASFYRDLLIAKTAPTRVDLVTITPPTWSKLCTLTQALDISVILAGQQHLRSCEAQVKNTTQPRLWLEVTLLGLLPTVDSHQLAEPDSKHGYAAASNQQSETSQAQPSIQHQQSTRATTDHAVPVDHLSDLDSITTSTATNGASQDQGAQPTQVGTSAFCGDYTDGPKAVPSAQASSAVEVPEVTFNHPAPSESTVDKSLEAEQELDTSPESEASPADTVVQQPDLDQLWRNVIDQLQPFSTQALLEQLCHLIAFDGQQARVGIRSQSWLKTAQEKLPNIEAAFQVVFERSVKVHVEVAAPTDSKATLGRDQRSTTAPAPVSSVGSPNVTSAANDSAAVLSSPIPSGMSQPRSQTGIAEPTLNRTREINQSITPSSTQPFQPATGALPQTAKSSVTHSDQTTKSDLTWKEDNEVSRGAKSLAHFFNGEIVRQENELIPGSIPPSDELYSSGQSLTDLTEHNASEPNGEDEIPF